MNAFILLLFAAADPTGLQAAFESADSMDKSFMRTCFTVTLVNPETIRKMAPLVQVEGEAHKLLGIPSTQEIIRVTLHSGEKKTDFWLLGNREIVFGGDLIKTADDKLWVALRAISSLQISSQARGGGTVNPVLTPHHGNQHRWRRP